MPVETPVWTVVAAVALVVAAWIAAGSVGVLADPLQRVLTWVALLTALGAGMPRPGGNRAQGLGLAAAVIVGLLMTAAQTPETHVLAVALVAAALAWSRDGLPRRVLSLASLAVAILAISRIALGAAGWLWLAADASTGALAALAGKLAGQPLDVGATYGGLDFLVVMLVIYAGWLRGTPQPRLQRGLIAAGAIVAGHLAYLALLAYAESFRDMLPEVVRPAPSDRDLLGIWTWGNAAHRLLPWNVPLLAMLIHGAILAAMLRWTEWLPEPSEGGSSPAPHSERKHVADEQLASSALLADLTMEFGPFVLAVLLPLIGWLAPGASDLKGKTVVAYDEAYPNWLLPTHEELGVETDGALGTLPALVERLGGVWLPSEELSAEDLEQADVVVLAHPDRPWGDGQLDRLVAYVRGGGALLVAGGPRIAQRDSVSSFDELLRLTAIRVNDDTAVGHQPNWEDGFQLLADPAVLGASDAVGRFGFREGASLRAAWPARPVLVGRYGYSVPGSDAALTSIHGFEAGHRLGDLVLAAEQRFGAGRVFVLGDTWPLSNQMLVDSYEFAGRLLGYLAARGGTPQAWWRQWLSLLAAAGLVILLVRRPEPKQVVRCVVVLAASLACMRAGSYWSSPVLPDGRAEKPRNNVAYIDAAHAEFYGREPYLPDGLASFQRTLIRNGYLPLRLSQFSEERLERAGLLVAIAPGRAYGFREIGLVEKFVRGGGHFICMVGAEESRPIRPLLAAFGFRVPPSPVHPGENLVEPIPLSSFRHRYYGEGQAVARVQFWNGWPVECDESDAVVLTRWTLGEPESKVVVSRRIGAGTVTVIGDSYFALNRNFESLARPWENDHYWRWLLTRLMGPQPWYPTPSESDEEPDDNEDETADDEEASDPMAPESDMRDPAMELPARPQLMEPGAGMIVPDMGILEPKGPVIEPGENGQEPPADDEPAGGMTPDAQAAPSGSVPKDGAPAELDELKMPNRFRRLAPPDSEPLSMP